MSEQTMSNHARAVKIVKDWRERWGGIPHDTYAGGSLSDLIDRVTEALSPPVPLGRPPRVDRYCVIGVDAYQREWFLTLDDAVDHTNLMRPRAHGGSVQPQPPGAALV